MFVHRKAGLQVLENKEDNTTRQAAQAERAAFTEKKILDAAEVVFARRGLAGTRVREIAEAAGVNSATLYNYYPGKVALYEAVFDRGMRPLLSQLASFAAGTREPESTQHVVRAVMRHLAARPHLSRLIYLETIAEGSYLPELAKKWFRPLLEQILGELADAPSLGDWEERLFPAVAALFVHLSFGHFALAPLLKEVFPGDPLSDEGVAAQTRLIETLVDQMFPPLAAGAAEAADTTEASTEK
jgi:AcrR family transcriptional regulator